MSTLKDSADPTLPEHLLGHLDAAEAAAKANVDKAGAVNAVAMRDWRRQFKEVTTANVPVKSRTIRIRHLGAQLSEMFTPFSACRAKCSHCCHVDVLVPLGEAKLMAKALGRKLAMPASTTSVGNPPPAKYIGTPCTFLKDGACSIYAHRPLVCRTLLNMDSIPLLCELVPNKAVPVPFLNTMELQALFAFVHQDEPFADIRDWFPKEG